MLMLLLIDLEVQIFRIIKVGLPIVLFLFGFRFLTVIARFSFRKFKFRYLDFLLWSGSELTSNL